MSNDNPNKKRSVRRTSLIVLGLILIILFGWYWYSSTHPLSNSKYGFQFYQPTQLPSGFHITEKRIDIVKPDGEFLGIQAEMNFRTVDWVYTIQESRANTSASPVSNTTATKLDNYDPKSVGFTCEQQRSPKGQSYRLCHSVDYGKISVYETSFIKDKTYISTRFPTTTDKVVPIDQINTYVDSFVKAKAAGFKILSGGI